MNQTFCGSLSPSQFIKKITFRRSPINFAGASTWTHIHDCVYCNLGIYSTTWYRYVEISKWTVFPDTIRSLYIIILFFWFLPPPPPPSSSQSKQQFVVMLLQHCRWPEDARPPSTSAVLSLVDQLDRVCQKSPLLSPPEGPESQVRDGGREGGKEGGREGRREGSGVEGSWPREWQSVEGGGGSC